MGGPPEAMSSPVGRPPKRRTRTGVTSPPYGLPKGDHMGPGAAGLRSGLVFAFCGPWTHVMRLRPGHTEMRTHQAPFYCANALGTRFSVTGLVFRSGALTGAVFLRSPTGALSRLGALTGLYGFSLPCPALLFPLSLPLTPLPLFLVLFPLRFFSFWALGGFGLLFV
jgi:hypothetical protein